VLPDESVQFPLGAAAAQLGCGRSVAPGAAHQLAQLLQIALRMLGTPARRGFVTRQQLGAPALRAMQRERRTGRAQPALRHRLAQRLGIDATHQLADVLQLASAALVGARPLPLAQRLEQRFRHRQRREPLLWQGCQRRAEFLQVVRCLLQPGLAGPLDAGRFARVRGGRGRSVVGCHEQRRMNWSAASL
jgi:hypothetical protein